MPPEFYAMPTFITATLHQWIATLLALALGTLHPAPRHDSQPHRQPVTVPELAQMVLPSAIAD